MSIVVWDGKTIACDRQGSMGGTRYQTPKMRIVPSLRKVLAWCGGHAEGLAMAEWYEEGANREKFPTFQTNQDRWSRLIIASSEGCSIIEMTHVEVPVIEKFFAWGSGMDYALGALAMGATASHAAEVACQFDHNCGLGVDVCDLTIL